MGLGFQGKCEGSCFGNGCLAEHMLLEHERSYGLGMDALVTVCSLNTTGNIDYYGLGMGALVTVCSWSTNFTIDYYALAQMLC